MTTYIGDLSATALGALGDDLAARFAIGQTPPSGEYLAPFLSVTTASIATGRLRLSPLAVRSSVAIDRLRAEVTSAGTAGSVVDLCVYSSGPDGLPLTLVASGEIDGTSATTQDATVSVTLPAGMYWVGGLSRVAAPTMRVHAAGSGSALVSFASSTVSGVSADVTVSTSSLPSTISSPTLASGFSVPRVLLRVA